MKTPSSPSKRKTPDSADKEGKKRRVLAPLAPEAMSTPTPTLSGTWQSKIGISPPQKRLTDPANADELVADVEREMKKDGFGYYIVEDGFKATEEQQIVYFLYGDGFYKDKDPKTRTDAIKEFLDHGPKKRMMDILKKDSDTQCPHDIKKWRIIQGVVLCYTKQEGATTIFDEKNMPVVMRTQASQNCYRHAAAGTVGYKIAFDKADNGYCVHTVDVAKYTRRTITDENLYKRVVKNKGGRSRTLLQKMAGGIGLRLSTSLPGSVLKIGTFGKNVIELIKQEGPALVSRFRTDAFFKNGGKLRGSGTSSYLQENGIYYIPQFDRINGKDTLKFIELGRASSDDQRFIKLAEKANKKPTNDNRSVMAVVSSCSEDSASSTEKDDTTAASGDGLHAMILIGGRNEEETEWFLIQNTWSSIPIFEASKSYLVHHLSPSPLTKEGEGEVPSNGTKGEGALVFLQGSVPRSDSSLPLVDRGLCLESNACDVAENDEYGTEEEEGYFDDADDSDLEE